MWWYIGRRVIQAIPVLLGATLLIYAMVFALPGDPITALFGEKPVSESVRANLESQYNLDKPFIVQWLLYLGNALTGDFGMSLQGRAVSEMVGDALPITFRLAVLALLFEMIFGIAAGFYAGLKRGRIFDSTMLIVSLLVIAVPIFVFGFVMQFFFGVKLRWAPVTVGGDPSWTDLILPAIVLGLVSFAYILRLTRTSIVENLTADHVRTARAKGLSNGEVNRRHVLRNSLIPVVTYLGTDLGTLMAGAIVTEGIFNIPGLGNLAFTAVNRGDGALVVGVVTVMVLIYLVMSLIVDLLYAVLDPRIRYA